MSNKFTSRKSIPQCTQAEAFGVALFGLLRESGVPIENPPEAMHRQMLGKIEADVLVRYLGVDHVICLDGRRWHGDDPNINHGEQKFFRDIEHRSELLFREACRLINVREHPLPPLPLGDNVDARSLSYHAHTQSAFMTVVEIVLGKGSPWLELITPEFLQQVRKSASGFWLPRLREHLPLHRQLRSILPADQLTELISLCITPGAATHLPYLGKGCKMQLDWKCPQCGRTYLAKISALLSDTKSRGCPYCGGGKLLVFEDSVAADASSAPYFIKMDSDPGLKAHEVSIRSGKMAHWHCRNPKCTRVCRDRPNNRHRGHGYCRECFPKFSRKPAHWVSRAILKEVRETCRALLRNNPKATFLRDVFPCLKPGTQSRLLKLQRNRERLSKWGLKVIAKLR